MCLKPLFQLFVSLLDHSFWEGGTIEFTPHQVVIKDFKHLKHVLIMGIIDDITRLHRFNNSRSSPFSFVFIYPSGDLSKHWHD